MRTSRSGDTADNFVCVIPSGLDNIQTKVQISISPPDLKVKACRVLRALDSRGDAHLISLKFHLSGKFPLSGQAQRFLGWSPQTITKWKPLILVNSGSK